MTFHLFNANIITPNLNELKKISGMNFNNKHLVNFCEQIIKEKILII